MSKAWQIVAVLFVIAGLNYADRAATSSVFPLLRRDLGLTDLQMGATGSFFLWAYATGSPFAGRLADSFSRSRLIVASLVAWSMVTIATGCVSSTAQLLLTRVLLGVAECMYLPAAVALIADHHSAQTRASAMGIHLAGLNFGLVGGGALAGYMGEHYGWRVGFFVLGGVGLLLAALASLILTDNRSDSSSQDSVQRPGTISTLRALFAVPSYWIVVGQAMVIAVGIWMFINWLPLYFRETFGMSLSGAGFFGTFMLQGASTLGILAGGYLSDKVSTGNRARRMLFQALCYLAATPFLLVFLGTPGYGLVSVAIFCFSFLRAVGASNEHPVVCDLLPPNMRSTAVGIMNTTNCLAGGIGILMAGRWKEGLGLASVFAGVSGLILFAALLVFFGYRYLLPRDLAKRVQASEQEEQAWLAAPRSQSRPVSPRTAT
jgi:predicted MFS family arabinose efflux permease